MGRLLTRALSEAGLSPLAERALSGDGLSPADLATLRTADVLLVAGLADLVREKFHGDAVSLASPQQLRELPAVLVEAPLGEGTGETGAEWLREVALARLATPGARSIAVSFESASLQLAQTALVFGADVLVGDLGGKRTLPLLDGPEARRVEIRGLCERAGRTVRFVDADGARAQQETLG